MSPGWKPVEAAYADRYEAALVGAYEMTAFDVPPYAGYPRAIGWGLFMEKGPNLTQSVAGGPAGSFEAARVAAEEAFAAAVLGARA